MNQDFNYCHAVDGTEWKNFSAEMNDAVRWKLEMAGARAARIVFVTTSQPATKNPIDPVKFFRSSQDADHLR